MLTNSTYGAETMKKSTIAIPLTLIACATFSFVVTGTSHAATRTVPAKMRGTWYKYQQGEPYYKIKLTKHYLFTRDYFQNHYSYNHFKVTVAKVHRHGQTWYYINPVNKDAGPVAYYRYSSIKVKGKWHRSLQFREGQIYYRLFKTKVPYSYGKTVPIWN